MAHNADGTWTLHDEDGTTQTYVENQYLYTYLTNIVDRSGVGWVLTYSYNAQTYTNTITVTHTNGQFLTVVDQTVMANGKVTGVNETVTDPAGNKYYYTKGGIGGITDFETATLPGSPSTVISYKYNNDIQDLLSEVDYNGTPYWTDTYDSNGRAIQDGAADGTQLLSATYTFPSSTTMTATITNPLGHTTVNQYGPDTTDYVLLSISDSATLDCGSTIHTRAYDSNYNLNKTVDNNHITHTYQYAANGQLQNETEGYGTSVARTTNYIWDPNQQLNRLTRVVVVGESQIDYAYNAQNRLASITRTNLSPNGVANQALKTTYTYTLYSNGTVKQMVDTPPNSAAKVTTNYDALGNATSVVDGLGYTTTYSNYTALGKPQKVVGPNGDETDYTYDARGRVSTKTTHPNGIAATWTYTYDGFGLLKQIAAPDGEVTIWNRDAEMRVTTITHNDKDGTSTETFGYDDNDDVTSDVITRGSDVGKSTTTVYDALGRVYQRKGNHGQALTYAYDGNGNVLSVTDALNHKTSYTYDALNRVSTMTDAKSGVTQYFYDAGDHLAKVIDPRGLATTYTYDGLDLLWKQVSPDTGTTSFNYDTYGRLASKTRADGVQSTYYYDSLNRLTKISASGQNQTWSYDTCTKGLGRLCSTADAHSTVSYSYTPEGWIVGRGFTVDSSTYALGYSYNNMGQLAVVNYPDGNQANYLYTDGAVSNVSISAGPNKNGYMAGSITYRPMDLAMSGWKTQNGLVNTLSYDSDLRLSSISVPGTQSLAFNYDAADRLNKITNGIDGTMTQTLGYDELDRLTSVTSGADNESFTYDADGNRLTGLLNGDHWTYTPSASSNRLASASDDSWSGSYSYDAQGNMLGTAHQYWTYDSFGRMRTATPLSGSPVTTYDVNPEGQRLRKYTSTDGTWFAPDASGALLAEDQDGTWYDYVWLNGRLIGLTVSGAVYSLHDDQTGRPQVMTTPNTPNIAWAAQNEPFDRTVTTNAYGNFNLGFSR